MGRSKEPGQGQNELEGNGDRVNGMLMLMMMMMMMMMMMVVMMIDDNHGND